jgi:hypothetical protein
MLEKIVRINGIGRFRDYRASGDVTFRKLTLVYAETLLSKLAEKPASAD